MNDLPYNETSTATVARTSRWKSITVILSMLLIGFVVWDGADRRASDATQPLIEGSASRSLSTASKTLKIASFNIHSGKGSDGVRNLPRVADLLSDADFVGLYEVRGSFFDQQPNQAALLATIREMDWSFAPTERQWWSDHFGNGLMYRIPVSSKVRIPLVNTRGKAFRNAILATAQLDRTDVRIIAVHIDREADRRCQLETVIQLFLNLKEPCVLMGDLNTVAEDPLLINLREHSGVRSPLQEFMPKGPSYSTIDWIFTRGLKTISAELVDNNASDHPCLTAEFEPINVTGEIQ